MNTKHKYFLITESFGEGLVIECHSEQNLAIERAQIFYNKLYNQLDSPIEFTYLESYNFQEEKPLHIEPKFIRSNGFNHVYLIEIDCAIENKDFIESWIFQRVKQ